MKKIIIAILVLFLVGCSADNNVSKTADKEDSIVSDDGSVISGIDSDVAELLDKLGKVKNIKYQTRNVGDSITIEGNMIKVDYVKTVKVNEFFYKQLVIDRDAKTAKISCLDVCLDYDQEKVVLSVDYDSYNFETIFDLADSIKSAKMSSKSSVTILDREAIPVDTNIGEVWLDTSSGTPLKVDGKLDLTDLELNKVVSFGFPTNFKEMKFEEYVS